MRQQRRGVFLVMGALTALAACERGDPRPAAPAASATASAAGEATAYQAPPLPTAVVGAPGGPVTVKGRASPGVRVRAGSPDGAAYGTTAGEDGVFTLDLPAARAPRLFALSAEEGTRSVPGEGWLFIPPDDPRRAVLLRPGAAGVPVSRESLIAVVDYDAGGGAAVAGHAPANAAVKLYLDGAEAADAKADRTGAYATRLTARVTPGAHLLRAVAGGQSVERSISFAPGAAQGLFSAEREPAGWRVAWSPPGGGVQTTVVITEPGAR
jgi:hypothetical protein